MDNLIEYQKKRNFDRTLEPTGGERLPKGGRLIFAVQHHIASKVHYDFRLEHNGALLSWAVPKGPSFNPKDKRLAVMVEDHPLDYADFEGTIPKGQYGGGVVMLWDKGYYEQQFDISEGLASGAIKIILHGKRLKGKWALMKLKDGDNNWLIVKENDQYALSEPSIMQLDTSVKSGLTMSEIESNYAPKTTKNPFEVVAPMKPKLVGQLPQDGDWLYEIKYDGYRMIAYCSEGIVRLATRNNMNYTQKFPLVAQQLSRLSQDRAFVLDGEVVASGDGKSDFQALQNCIKSGGSNAEYMVFDLLALDGEDLRHEPLHTRQTELNKLINKPTAPINISQPYKGGAEFFETAVEFGLEGIVGKRKNSLYSANRSGDWIKLKCYLRQEFVVGGYTRTDKSTTAGALLVGVYEGTKLVYCGRVGTGMSHKEAKWLIDMSDSMASNKCPFEDVPRARGDNIFWLKPKLIAEVKFGEWTDDNLLRQASFQGWREDKSPTEVVREVVGKMGASKPHTITDKSSYVKSKNLSDKSLIQSKKAASQAKDKGTKTATNILGVNISNPDKIVYQNPRHTKLDIANYYLAISKRMLPHIRGRILSVVRCHKGVDKDCFYNKHPVKESEGQRIVRVNNSDGEQKDYFAVIDEVGLINEVQLGALEFHVWGSREVIDKPDMMVFDLDPDEGLGLEEVRQGVKDLKKILDKLKLKSYLKTSGGKGYHVVVPVTNVDWTALHDFSREVALVMERTWSDRYTANSRKVNRKGKIYIDWARNGRGATSVAPYSLRAREGGAVSMPITWKELDTIAPNAVTLNSALQRLALPDPWRGYFNIEQSIDTQYKKIRKK